MLAQFLVTHREAIIARARALGASRPGPWPTDAGLENGIPVFLDQLGDALRLAESSDRIDHGQIGRSAGRHGLDLLRMGLTIAQVVRSYGDVCQAVTELAVQRSTSIPTGEFRTLNSCLEDAIAEAVTEYCGQQESVIKSQGTERLGVLAHELRNLLTTAILSFESIRRGRVASGGSSALLHARSLMGLRDLVDRSIADVRLDAGMTRSERICVAELIEEVEVGAAIQAQARGLTLAVAPVDRAIAIEGDRQSLAATLLNLLHNAFKFSCKQGRVSLTTHATAARVLFDVEDECGGLPPGKTEELFRPFVQAGRDRSGVGLGLSICLKAAKAGSGEIRVRNLPGKGCVFTLDLPRKEPPPLAVEVAEGQARDSRGAPGIVRARVGSGKAEAG